MCDALIQNLSQSILVCNQKFMNVQVSKSKLFWHTLILLLVFVPRKSSRHTNVEYTLVHLDAFLFSNLSSCALYSRLNFDWPSSFIIHHSLHVPKLIKLKKFKGSLKWRSNSDFKSPGITLVFYFLFNWRFYLEP